MTSNISAIRAVRAQIPQMRDQLRLLREEARADDGVVDEGERAEIEQVEGLIDTAQQLVAEKLQAWEANKTAYNSRRSGLDTSLGQVARSDIDAHRADQRAISDAATKVDQAAAAEDYALALSLADALEGPIELFLQQVENERLNGLTTEELTQISLADDAIEEVFSEDYMRELMTMEFRGEGTPALRDVIRELEKGLSSTNRAEVIGDLAEIVGTPPTAADLDADYARYLILCRQRDAIGDQNHQTEPEAVDEEKHPDFVGSHEQLMFGKVLGDALGIHEVFATLLSPTGGLVGPGNDLIPAEMMPDNPWVDSVDAPHLSPDNPVALHGTVHDAAGYLQSFHNEGPGYNYRGNEIEGAITSILEFFDADALLPLTGQASGIAYWTMEAGDEYVEARFDEGVVALENALAEARDGAADQVAEIVFAIEEAKQDLSDRAAALRDDMVEAAEQVEQDLRDLAEEVENEVLEARDAFEDGVERVSRAAVETYEDISDAASSFGDGVKDKLGALANFIWN